MTMSAAKTVMRGTCTRCGRWVTTYTRGDDNVLRAYAHKAWHSHVGADRVWRECSGSSEPVVA
jgi:hypothetical protein